MRSWRSNMVVISLVLLVSCASEAASSPQPTTVSVATTIAPQPTAPPGRPTATALEARIAPTAPQTGAATVQPVERVAENPGVATGGHWIGRGSMSKDAVELVWASVGSSDVDVRYLVYRVPSLGADVETIDVQGLTRVYVGSDTAFVDRTVEPNTFYSYILVAEIDGVALSRRWTNALTITDTEPPAPVQIISTETTSEGATICWSPSSDNVEFASYSVSLVLENGELQYLGGGADLGQTCFVDTRPPSGSATYAIQAVDFHDNRSEPATIVIEG